VTANRVLFFPTSRSRKGRKEMGGDCTREKGKLSTISILSSTPSAQEKEGGGEKRPKKKKKKRERKFRCSGACFPPIISNSQRPEWWTKRKKKEKDEALVKEKGERKRGGTRAHGRARPYHNFAGQSAVGWSYPRGRKEEGTAQDLAGKKGRNEVARRRDYSSGCRGRGSR